MKLHGCNTTSYYSIHDANWKHIVCNKVVWKTQCQAACQKLKVKHMHGTNSYRYWSEFGTLPQSYVGYQNTYGHSWSHPFPQPARTGLVKKTWSPCCCGEDSLNKPSTTWGLGFYIQTPCAWASAEAGGMQTNACWNCSATPRALSYFQLQEFHNIQTSLRGVGKLRPEVRVG